jgi:hypothetical protein
LFGPTSPSWPTQHRRSTLPPPLSHAVADRWGSPIRRIPYLQLAGAPIPAMAAAYCLSPASFPLPRSFSSPSSHLQYADSPAPPPHPLISRNRRPTGSTEP